MLDLSYDDNDGSERMDSIYNKMVSLKNNEYIYSELDIYLTKKLRLEWKTIWVYLLTTCHGGSVTA